MRSGLGGLGPAREGLEFRMSFWSITYERHSPAIRAFLTKRLLDQEAAADICQETFVRAIDAEHTLRDKTKVRSFLFRTAHNLMINQIRRRGLVKNETDISDTSCLDTAVDTRQISPEAATEWTLLTEKVRDLMKELSPDLARAFELGIVERRSYAEIAKITGWSDTKVKATIFRARKKVMVGLREYRPVSGGKI